MVLSGRQIRAARAVLRWTEEELARRAGVSVEAITGMESVNGLLPETDELERIGGAIEGAGISLIESGCGLSYAPSALAAGDPPAAARMRAARVMLGWTQEDLARKAGVPVEEVIAIEDSDQAPSDGRRPVRREWARSHRRRRTRA